MKKLPKIYQGELSKIHNNKEVFDSLKEKSEIKEVRVNKNYDRLKDNNTEIKEVKVNKNYDKLSVRDKIKELINQNSYIFNTKVIINVDNEDKECQIAGVVNNHIITMDNEIISIERIKDIKILK